MRVHSYTHTHTQTHTNPNKQTWMRKRVRDVASSLVLSRHVLRCVLHIVYYTDTQSSIYSFFVFFFFVSIFISLSLSLLICWSTLPYTYAVFVYWYLFRFDMFVCKCALFTVSGVVRSVVRSYLDDGRIVHILTTRRTYACVLSLSRSIYLSDSTTTDFIF